MLSIIWFALAVGVWLTSAASDYREKLLLRPLPGNSLLASFNFRSNTSLAAFDQQNFRLFPRSLGQILRHAHAKELHLRFSVGRWDDEAWGERPWNGAREGGTGVELWAWVEAKTDEEATTRWLALTNALSGLFCASLNFIDSTRTIRPVKAFEPEGIHATSMRPNLHLLHGVLPHEVVCTENLTPFIKLLPCKGKSGIASLLDGHKLFDASWQIMAIDVRPVCFNDNEHDCVFEIEQTADMVLDGERSRRPRDDPIPRPVPFEDLECDVSKSYNAHDSCFPLQKRAEPAWKLSEIFSRTIQGDCPLVERTSGDANSVCINAQPDRIINTTTRPENAKVSSEKRDGGFLKCYKPPANGAALDVELVEQEIAEKLALSPPKVSASRSFAGYGQERGAIQSVITNHSPDEVDIIYMESLPWFMKPYIHTLETSVSPAGSATPVLETYFRPGLDRKRGAHLEVKIRIPAQSTLRLSYDFEKAILRYTEYPPDANRGFDVAPAVIKVLQSPGEEGADAEAARHGVYIRTTSLLLMLPTPDFSMPYNVIILTSTVMALGFGGVYNILTRRFVAAHEAPPSTFGAALAGVMLKLRQRIRQGIAKTSGRRTKVE